MVKRTGQLVFVYVDGGEYRDGKSRIFQVIGKGPEKKFRRASREAISKAYKSGKCKAAYRVERDTKKEYNPHRL